MAAQSSNKEDVFNWVWDVISSCESVDQYFVATKLLRLFIKNYNDTRLIGLLKSHRMDVWNQLQSEVYKN